MSDQEHSVGVLGGFLASPVGGGIAGVLFATESCSVIGCVSTYNANAAFAVTFIGWVLTGIVAFSDGDDNWIAFMIFAFAAGAGLGALLA